MARRLAESTLIYNRSQDLSIAIRLLRRETCQHLGSWGAWWGNQRISDKSYHAEAMLHALKDPDHLTGWRCEVIEYFPEKRVPKWKAYRF